MFQEMMPMSQPSGGSPTHVETVTISGGSSATITCGFVPKKIAVVSDYASATSFVGVALWDEENGNRYVNTNASNSAGWRTFGEAGGISLALTSDGFTVGNARTSSTKYHVFAIG